MEDAWFGNEAAAVEARFLPDGEIRPSAFTWRGLRRTVTGLGRQWDDDDGRHILVVAADGSRFELCLCTIQNSWRVLRAWLRPYLA